ncbi:NUDIX hydrolase [Vibrio sp.]|nr:NUDIX hydrolase [Vibrio sp.]
MTKIIHTWKRISLVEEEVTLPSGKDIIHTSILHPGAAVILPIDEDGNIILIHQYRPSLHKWILELPAGTIEKNETPSDCAKRELLEETGIKAEHLFPLGQATPLAGFCDEIQYLFVAKTLTETHQTQHEEDEVIEVVKLKPKELETYIIDGRITDTKTIACLSKAKLCGML